MRRQRRRTPRRRNWLVQGTKKFAYPATKEKDFLEICWRHNSLVPGTKREDFLEGQFAHSGGKEEGLPGDPMRLWCCAGDKDVRLLPLFLVNPTPRHCHSFRRHPRNTRCAKTQWPNLFGPKRLDDKANPFAVEAAPTAAPGSCLYTMHFNRAIEPESISYLRR